MPNLPNHAQRFITRLAFVVMAPLVVDSAIAPRQGGELQGRVLGDSSRTPLNGAQATLPGLGLSALTDAAGKFRITNIRPGEHILVLKAAGFTPETTFVQIDEDAVIASEFVLKALVSSLPSQRVVGREAGISAGRLAEFEERRRNGAGHFIDEAMLLRYDSSAVRLGDVLDKVPGVRVHRGENKSWVASTRALNTGRCVFCQPEELDRADRAAGAGHACYLDVYLDGVKVFNSAQPGNGLFDVNTLALRSIVAIEVFTSASQIPAKYNQSSGGCGVMLIWTR